MNNKKHKRAERKLLRLKDKKVMYEVKAYETQDKIDKLEEFLKQYKRDLEDELDRINGIKKPLINKKLPKTDLGQAGEKMSKHTKIKK